MRLIFILFLFLICGCTSITKRELEALNSVEIAKYKPNKVLPVKVYIYADLGPKHDIMMRVDLPSLVKSRLSEIEYFSDIEVVTPQFVSQNPIFDDFETELKNMDSFFNQTKDNKITLTIYFREIEQKRTLIYNLNLFATAMTLGILPLKETSKFITGVQIQNPKQNVSFDRIYRENIEATTTSIKYSGYKPGKLHLYDPVVDAVVAALVEYSKTKGLK